MAYVEGNGKLEEGGKEILGTCRSIGLVNISFFLMQALFLMRKYHFK